MLVLLMPSAGHAGCVRDYLKHIGTGRRQARERLARGMLAPPTHRQSSRSQSFGAMVQLTASTSVLSAQAAREEQAVHVRPAGYGVLPGGPANPPSGGTDWARPMAAAASCAALAGALAGIPARQKTSGLEQLIAPIGGPHSPRSSTRATCLCCRSRSHSSTARRLVAAGGTGTSSVSGAGMVGHAPARRPDWKEQPDASKCIGCPRTSTSLQSNCKHRTPKPGGHFAARSLGLQSTCHASASAAHGRHMDDTR